MSQAQQSGGPHGPPTAPSLEPWLIVCLLAFVPGTLIVLLPHAALRPALLPIVGSMVVLTCAGLVMLWRAERTKHGSELVRRNDSAEAAEACQPEERYHPLAGGARDS